MDTMHTRPRARWDQVALAALLLVGVVLTALGYSRADRILLYAGLFVVIAGVLLGITRMLSTGGR